MRRLDVRVSMKATIDPTCGRAVRNSSLDCDQGAAITWIAERNVSWIVMVTGTETPYSFRGTLAAEIADHMVFGPTNEIEYFHWTRGVTAIELMAGARSILVLGLLMTLICLYSLALPVYERTPQTCRIL